MLAIYILLLDKNFIRQYISKSRVITVINIFFYIETAK